MAEHVWNDESPEVCRVCGQTRGRAEAVCPRTRDWNIPTRPDPAEIERLKQVLKPDPVNAQLKRDEEAFGLSVARRTEDGKRERVDPRRVMIRETEIEAKPAPSVVARRAFKVEINSCDDCPWYRVKTNACASDGHGTGAARYLEDDDDDPPEWCPIRGMVAIIGGPRA